MVNRSVDRFGKRTGGEDGCSNPGKERRNRGGDGSERSEPSERSERSEPNLAMI